MIESHMEHSRMGGRRLVDLAPGQKLGRYEILGEIGAGGMATVFRARDLELERVVALKVLPSHVTLDDRFVSRFLHEARTVARLSHPAIVQVHDIGQDRGAWYISMELIPGQNLAEYLREETPNLQQSVQIASQIAEAIAYTHEHGVMHRDLKPSNVLMRGDQPVVIDFGLSKDILLRDGAVLTNDGEMVGSPAYMSPEQAKGEEVDQGTDICALGILLYELISFKNPYLDPRSIHQTVMNVMAAEPVPLRQMCPWVDRELDAVVHKALSRDRSDRYETMEAFAKDLRAWLAGKPVTARPPGVSYHLRSFVREKALVLWIAGVTLAFALLGLGYLQLQERLSRTPWTVFTEETFDSPTPAIHFESWRVEGTRNSPVLVPGSEWKVEAGRLVGKSEGFSFCRSTEDFLGNLRVEFDVTGGGGSNHDFDVFLYGDRPSNGVRFFLGQWGSHRAGIETSDDRYQWLPSEMPLEVGKTYHVMVERDGQRLRLFVDGRLVDERVQVLPPTRTNGYRLGFFTWNSKVYIDNIQISRRTIALKASPTVVADAFLDEGLLDHAINAYHSVVQSYPTHDVAQEAQLKLGTIAMVRNQYKQALDMFGGVVREPMSKDLRLQALFLQSIALQSAGDLVASQKAQESLVEADRDHPANVALIQNQLERIEGCLDLSVPMFYGCASEGETVFRFLARIQPNRQELFGPIHLRFAEALRLWGGIAADSNFLNTTFQFDQYYAKRNPEIAADLWIIRARHERDMRRNERAEAILTQVAEGEVFSGAMRGELSAMVELGRTLAWEGKPADAERWFRRVVETGGNDEYYISQALFEWGVATVLARRDGKARWQEILDRKSAPWMLHQQAAFLAGKIDSSELHAAMSTPEGLNPDFFLVVALGALQRGDLARWHLAVDDLVRRYPYSNGLWDIRRVVEWAETRTPRPHADMRRQAVLSAS
ncbi:MAG: protein kinase [Fibrobacteria bacterium]|nr:protein kinase [Fibrobacteria bacterium]